MLQHATVALDCGTQTWIRIGFYVGVGIRVKVRVESLFKLERYSKHVVDSRLTTIIPTNHRTTDLGQFHGEAAVVLRCLWM